MSSHFEAQLKKIVNWFLALSTVLMPLALAAQLPPPVGGGTPGGGGAYSLNSIFTSVFGLLNTLIVFLILLATVIFLWGIVKYIMAGGDEEQIADARRLIIWGIIFLGVMIAIWGFVNVLLDFIFGTGQGRETVPTGPQQGAQPSGF
jgi:hypothetical protein